MPNQKTTNEELRDETISRDISNQRVSAAVQKEVDDVLVQLEADLKRAAERIDPWSKKLPRARRRAQARLIKRSNELIAAAYAKCAQINRESGKRLAVAESASTAMDIRDAIP